MQYNANTPEEYIQQLPEERKHAIQRLRDVIKSNLPDGLEETMSYGMISYVIPHELYPRGYHANPKEPLPFISIASQKNHIALYHMGIYAFSAVMEWYKAEYLERLKIKPDIGKSCIRYKKPEHIPYDLIAELCGKISIADYIRMYESYYP